MDIILLILAFLCALGVIKIIKEILAQRKCPPEHQLKRVIRGQEKSNSERSRRITAHLGVCEKCRKQVEEWNSKE